LVISTYFSPSAERGRMISVESLGSGVTRSSSESVRSAATLPFSCGSVSMSVTTPTREPPIRTSLPRTRPLAFGTFAVRS
jgi:hypothetical protein